MKKFKVYFEYADERTGSHIFIFSCSNAEQYNAMLDREQIRIVDRNHPNVVLCFEEIVNETDLASEDYRLLATYIPFRSRYAF
jgi:hypothetical protein